MAMLALKASGTFVRIAADGYAVAAVSQHLPDPEAYARVFAAAPDLLAALIECRKQINTIIEDGTPTDWHAWRADLDAIIAKAEAA